MYIIMDNKANLILGRQDLGNIAEHGMSCMATAKGHRQRTHRP